MTRPYWDQQSAFFRMSEDDLRTRLHGWRLPPPLLAEPVHRRGINPFTKEPLEFMSWLPEQPLVGSPDAVRSPRLDHCDWVSTEGLQPNDMGELTALVLGCDPGLAYAHWGLFLAGPEDANDILQPVPDELVSRVAALTAASIRELASAWNAAAGPPEMAEGGAWSQRILERVHGFFREAPTASYYFWTCR